MLRITPIGQRDAALPCAMLEVVPQADPGGTAAWRRRLVQIEAHRRRRSPVAQPVARDDVLAAGPVDPPEHGGRVEQAVVL